MKIILALLIFSLIVLFHEFGHFLLAKRGGIGVTEFSLGMGPRLLSKQIGRDSGYSCESFCPSGGSCMMVGEDGETQRPENSLSGANPSGPGFPWWRQDPFSILFWPFFCRFIHRRQHRLRRAGRGGGRMEGYRGGGGGHAAGGPDRADE